MILREGVDMCQPLNREPESSGPLIISDIRGWHYGGISVILIDRSLSVMEP